MSITYIPQQENSFDKYGQPYLQMAMQMLMNRQIANEQFQREKELKQIPTPLSPEIASYYKAFTPQAADQTGGQSTMPALNIDEATGLPKFGGTLISGISRSGIKFQPKDQKAEQAEQEKQSIKDFARSETQKTLDIISSIKNAGIEKNNTLMGYVGQKIPFTPSKGFSSMIDQLRAKLKLEELRKMRVGGKGTGFGNLSDAEGQSLQDSATRLAIGLPTSEFNKEINYIESTLKKSLEGNPQGKEMNQGQEVDPLGLR